MSTWWNYFEVPQGLSNAHIQAYVKKRYKREALRLHPNKVTNKINSTEKFQRLGAMYQAATENFERKVFKPTSSTTSSRPASAPTVFDDNKDAFVVLKEAVRIADVYGGRGHRVRIWVGIESQSGGVLLSKTMEFTWVKQNKWDFEPGNGSTTTVVDPVKIVRDHEYKRIPGRNAPLFFRIKEVSVITDHGSLKLFNGTARVLPTTTGPPPPAVVPSTSTLLDKLRPDDRKVIDAIGDLMRITSRFPRVKDGTRDITPQILVTLTTLKRYYEYDGTTYDAPDDTYLVFVYDETVGQWARITRRGHTVHPQLIMMKYLLRRGLHTITEVSLGISGGDKLPLYSKASPETIESLVGDELRAWLARARKKTKPAKNIPERNAASSGNRDTGLRNSKGRTIFEGVRGGRYVRKADGSKLYVRK